MWKNKIKEWGLDKKNKKDDVLAILRKKAERDAAGKKTVFRLRGRDVNLEKVQKYVTRNHISETTIGELVASRPQTPPDLQCFTPEPVPETIIGRGVCYVQEQILRRVQTYMVAGYQQSMWRLSDDGFRVTAPPFQTRESYEGSDLKVASDHFTRAVYSVGGLLRDDRPEDALSCLSSACSVVDTVVREATFHRIIILFWHPTYLNDPAIIIAISGYIAAVARSVLSADDPRRQIYLLMGCLGVDQLQMLHLVMCSLLANEVEKLVGKFNEVTWTQKLEPLKYRSGGTESKERLAQMSAEADDFWGPYDQFPIYLLRLKARLSYYMSQFNIAEEEFRQTIERLRHLHHLQLPKSMDWAWNYQYCVHDLALAQHAQGNLVSAVASIKSCFAEVRSVFKTDYKSPAILTFLEKLLRQLGKFDEADDVRAKRLSCPKEEHVLPSLFTRR